MPTMWTGCGEPVRFIGERTVERRGSSSVARGPHAEIARPGPERGGPRLTDHATRLSSLAHRIEELLVALRLLQPLQKQLHGLHGRERVQNFAEHPDALELPLVEQELLLARPRLVDVDRGEDALLGEFAV